jgi:hypothetical protein
MPISRTLVAGLAATAIGLPAAARAVPPPFDTSASSAAPAHRIGGLPPELRTLPGSPARR